MFSSFTNRAFARPRRCAVRASVSLVVLISSIPLAYAAEAPLTLAEAQRRAIAYSRQLSAKDFAATGARESAIAAAQLPDPVLKIGVDNLPVSGVDRFSLTKDFMTMRRVGVMQEITRADKRRLRAQTLNQTAEKSMAEKEVAK